MAIKRPKLEEIVVKLRQVEDQLVQCQIRNYATQAYQMLGLS